MGNSIKNCCYINQTRLSCYMTLFSFSFINCIYTPLIWHHSFRHFSCRHVVKFYLFFENDYIVHVFCYFFLNNRIMNKQLHIFTSCNMTYEYFVIYTNISSASLFPIAKQWYVYFCFDMGNTCLLTTLFTHSSVS